MQRTLDLAIAIGRPAVVVYEHLANPANMLGLQPLLTTMSPIRTAAVAGRRVYTYETVEAFRVGGVRLINNPIRVETTLTQPGRRLDSLVRSFPRITLAVRYDLEPVGQATQLSEHITLVAPRLLMWFVASQAMQVQRQTLANLKARLEAEVPVAGQGK